MKALTPTKFLIAAGLLVLVTLWILTISMLGDSEQSGSSQPGPAEPKPTPVENNPEEQGELQGPDLRQEYYWNIDDPGLVAGGSDNVYVGEVLAQIDDKPQKSSDPNDPGIPHTQFNVRVDTVIKSSGTGAVKEGQNLTVDALGGVNPENGQPIPITIYYQTKTEKGHDDEAAGGGHEADEDETHGEKSMQDTLIEPGERYLFATKYNYTEDWHTVYAHPTGKKLLDSPAVEQATVEVYRRAAENGEDPEAGEEH